MWAGLVAAVVERKQKPKSSHLLSGRAWSATLLVQAATSVTALRRALSQTVKKGIGAHADASDRDGAGVETGTGWAVRAGMRR